MVYNGEAVEIGIISAMSVEMQKFKPYLSKFGEFSIQDSPYFQGVLGGKRVVLTISDVGQINAAARTAAFILRFNPKFLFFCGIAGAVNPLLEIGTTVIGQTILAVESLSLREIHKTGGCRYGNLPSFKFTPPPTLLNIATQVCEKATCTSKLGIIASSDYFPIPYYLPEHFENQKLDAIDMESAAFSQTCIMFNKNYIVVRGISNQINRDSLDFKLENSAVDLASENAACFIIKFIESMPPS